MVNFVKISGLGKLLLLLKKRFEFVALLHTYLVLAKHAKPNILLVYTMGKVGSSTVTYLLEDQLQNTSVYQLHWLSQKNLRADKRFHRILYKKNRKSVSIEKYRVSPDYIRHGFFVRKRIKRLFNQNEELKICTLVRDPIERNISSFFQNLKIFFGYDVAEKLKEKRKEEIVDELISIFLENYISGNRKNFLDCDSLTWFDQELKEVFGLNVFQYPFNKDRGFDLYSEKNTSLLIMRLENLNECFQDAMSSFLGKSVQITESRNKADNKEYGDVYTMLKERIELPAWYLDKYYSSNFVKHFYTPAEIKNFRNKWYEK